LGQNLELQLQVWQASIKISPWKSCTNNQGSGSKQIRTGGPELSARWHGCWEIKPESTLRDNQWLVQEAGSIYPFTPSQPPNKAIRMAP
jgi:hypothetical protein